MAVLAYGKATRRIIVAKNRNKKSRKAKRIEAAILANKALVKLILEAGANMGPPMTLEEFRELLYSRKYPK
jgi:hypothetical protein